MGLLSDIFSGKKTYSSSHLKEKVLTLTIAGATIFSPINTVAAKTVPFKDKVSDKTEIVQNQDSLRIQTDSVTAKFSDFRLKNAAERMMKTQTGRSVLTKLTQKNIPVEMSSEIASDLGGAYFPASKKILINPACSNDLIASILVHEGTHALQAANGCRLGPQLNMESYINLNKAMEADAMKNQLFAAAELKDLGDASVYKEFAREHSMLVKSYERFCEKYGEQRDSIAKHTMLAYYNNRSYVKTYENRYVNALETFYKAAQKSNTPGIFQKDISKAEIIHRICHLDGKHYMNEADTLFLQDSARNYVMKSTYNSLEKLSKKHAGILNNNPVFKQDSSYQKFYIVDYKGRVLRNPTKGQNSPYTTKPIKTALSYHKQRNGR